MGALADAVADAQVDAEDARVRVLVHAGIVLDRVPEGVPAHAQVDAQERALAHVYRAKIVAQDVLVHALDTARQRVRTAVLHSAQVGAAPTALMVAHRDVQDAVRHASQDVLTHVMAVPAHAQQYAPQHVVETVSVTAVIVVVILVAPHAEVAPTIAQMTAEDAPSNVVVTAMQAA